MWCAGRGPGRPAGPYICVQNNHLRVRLTCTIMPPGLGLASASVRTFPNQDDIPESVLQGATLRRSCLCSMEATLDPFIPANWCVTTTNIRSCKLSSSFFLHGCACEDEHISQSCESVCGGRLRWTVCMSCVADVAMHLYCGSEGRGAARGTSARGPAMAAWLLSVSVSCEGSGLQDLLGRYWELKHMAGFSLLAAASAAHWYWTSHFLFEAALFTSQCARSDRWKDEKDTFPWARVWAGTTPSSSGAPLEGLLCCWVQLSHTCLS